MTTKEEYAEAARALADDVEEERDIWMVPKCLRQCADEIDALRTENARLRAALMRVGDDYPGSSCQQWCYEQVGIAPMIDHAPDPLHVTIEDALRAKKALGD